MKKMTLVALITVFLAGYLIKYVHIDVSKTDASVTRHDVQQLGEVARSSYPDARAPEAIRYVFCNSLPAPEIPLTAKKRPDVYSPEFTKRDGGKIDDTTYFCVQNANGAKFRASINYDNIKFRVNEDPKAVMSEIIPVFGGEAQIGEPNWFTTGDAPDGYKNPLAQAVVILTPKDYDLYFSNQ